MPEKKIIRANLSTQLYTSLRLALMEGQYYPGQRLTISGIAEEYGISITPVREAIFQLVSERALEMRASTSVVVPNLTPKDLREVLNIRRDLEGKAAYRVAETVTPDGIAELDALNAEFSKAAAMDPLLANRRNRDFHFMILRMSDMPIVESICENMWALMGPFLRIFHERMPVRELTASSHKHFDFIACLKRNDPDGAKRAMQTDIEWSEVLVSILEREGAEKASGAP